MAKILGIGNAVLDIILKTDHYPHEDEELRALSRHHQVGGNVCNSLYVLNQLGHESSLMTTLGGDQSSKQLLNGLQERRIQTEHIQRFIQGQTPTSYVLLNEASGSRTITHYRDLPELNFDFFAKVEIEQYDWLHFEGRNIDNLSGMLNIAKTFLSHQPISLEVEKPRDGIEALLPQANVIFFSHHYAKAKGYANGRTLLEAMREKAPQAHLICTWGTEGAWYASPDKPVQHQPIETIPQAVDTLGAGDTFNAGVIDSLLNGKTLSEAVHAGSRLAARKCRQTGLDNLMTEIKDKRPLANIKQVTNAKTLVVPCDELAHSVVLIKYEDSIKAYENNCPHQDVPLNEAYKIDVNPFDKTMKCSVHDAFFNIEDGLCVEGPCINDELTTVAIEIDEQGDIYLAQ
ncbi:PfkB family carbohydrate kinase [Thiomicrospira sp. S5]|uniref:PfkB family carbohydrate kinase n=1 Tax=Thiomicrospira sp. S5 TaxID=1803865 RepID=UPI000F8A133A|nr:PfkB family carbohydrate kinase [Thiomicrospira sp. S5]AZR81857.1 carbohydrate kinase [Thiomicrospira sp. S5]